MTKAELRDWLFKVSLPLAKASGKITDPFIDRWMTFDDVESARPHMRPGVGLFSRKRLELSNLFIQDHFTHAAIVAPNPDLIVQAIGVGVVDSTADDFFLDKDEVILRIPSPTWATEQDMLVAAEWAWGQRGKPYDYGFTTSITALFCSELFYDSYAETMHERAKLFTPKFVLGVPVPKPMDFVVDPNWSTPWMSARCSWRPT